MRHRPSGHKRAVHWVTMGEAQQVKGDVKFCKEPRGQSLEIHRDAPESLAQS